MADPTKGKKHPDGGVSETYRMLGIGIELAVSILGLTLIGWFLDQRYDWSPWGASIGAMLGIVGGCYNAIKEVNAAEKRRKRKAK